MSRATLVAVCYAARTPGPGGRRENSGTKVALIESAMDGSRRPSGEWRHPDERVAFGNASIVVDESWRGEASILSIIAGVEMDRIPAARIREALTAQGCYLSPERICAGLGTHYVFVYGQRKRDDEWICVVRQRRTRSGAFPTSQRDEDAPA